MTNPQTTPMPDGEAAKQYLINNDVWDEDYAICAGNIANKIAKDVDGGNEDIYYATKYGRRDVGLTWSKDELDNAKSN